MRTLFLTIILAAVALTACSDGKSSNNVSENAQTEISAVDTADMNTPALILWKAQQSRPLSGAEIDSVIEYLSLADTWLRRQLMKVKSEADFDSIEARYQDVYPYLESYSAILEQYAASITPEQMERVKAVAISMGNTIDSAATAIGIQ